MSEYVFRYASGYGSDMGALMDGGRVTVGDYFASESTDHYGTLHEEIVRCRDCKYAQDAIWPARLNIPSDYLDCLGELVEPWDYYNDEPKLNPVKPDGFCAWGELRGDDE